MARGNDGFFLTEVLLHVTDFASMGPQDKEEEKEQKFCQQEGQENAIKKKKKR